MQVDRYGTAGIKLDEYTNFFIPCGESPAPGDLVTCIGYPGEADPDVYAVTCLVLGHRFLMYALLVQVIEDAGILSTDESRRILATPEDYNEYLEKCSTKKEPPLPVSAFLLDAIGANQRMTMLDDSTDGLYVSNVLNASPGEVVAATEQVVQYRCSILPQMSGGPCKLNVMVQHRWTHVACFASLRHIACMTYIIYSQSLCYSTAKLVPTTKGLYMQAILGVEIHESDYCHPQNKISNMLSDVLPCIKLYTTTIQLCPVTLCYDLDASWPLDLTQI